jgi:hypothetical protein
MANFHAIEGLDLLQENEVPALENLSAVVTSQKNLNLFVPGVIVLMFLLFAWNALSACKKISYNRKAVVPKVTQQSEKTWNFIFNRELNS